MADTIIEHVYRLKGGEQLAVEVANPLLERREPIVVYCTDGKTRMKIGDGIHRFNELEWAGGINGGTGTNSNVDLDELLKILESTLDKKVDKQDGMGLYPIADQLKLKNIEEGANKTTIVNSALENSTDAISSGAVHQIKTHLEESMSASVSTAVDIKLADAVKNIVLDGGEI